MAETECFCDDIFRILRWLQCVIEQRREIVEDGGKK